MKGGISVSLAVLALLQPATQLQADTLYGATGSGGVAGVLYTIDPLTAATALVGSLEDSLGNDYGLTGLAFDPVSGLLYGSTANQSPTAAGHLVSVDPSTGLVTDIGTFGIISTLADIGFDPVSGVLYGWQAASGHQLYAVNLATGIATVVGSSTTGAFGGGGLAVSPDGSTVFSTPDGTAGDGLGTDTLRTIDEITGASTVVASVTGYPDGTSVINAMDFDSSGVLFGIAGPLSSSGTPSLVTIDFGTGALSSRGSLPSAMDALAFQFTRDSEVPEPSTWAACGFVLLAVGSTLWRRTRR